MKSINGTRTKKVKVEENEFFTGADTEAGTPCAGAEGIEASRMESAQTDVIRRGTVQTDAARRGAAQTDVVRSGKANAGKMTPDCSELPTGGLISDRRYKDTIFRMLFSDKKNLLELYNAVSGRHYDNPDDLQIVTLENAVYMGMKNDLAFLLSTGIYLYEHQSTVNPNMPLRNLFYISSEYSKLVETKSLYSSAIQKVPAPNFIVFYNGQDEVADRSEYRLSDAFAPRVDNPALELRVTVLNINYGRNLELMRQSRTLRDYAQYVALVRKYKEESGSLDDAVNRAVDECIKNDILVDFLRKNRAEVVMTSIFEYNKEEEERKLRTAERQAGYDEGYDSGFDTGYGNGYDIGIEHTLVDLVNEGIISIEQAAHKLHMTEDEFKKVMESKY